MDFQGRGIAGATVIGGDYRLGRVHYGEFIYSFEVVGFEEVDFEKFIYGFEEGWSEASGYFRRWWSWRARCSTRPGRARLRASWWCLNGWEHDGQGDQVLRAA